MLPTWPGKMVLFTIALLQTESLDAKRVLMLPYSFMSHARQMVAVGEELVDNGHEVYIALASSLPQLQLFENGKVKLLKHATPLPDFYQNPVDEGTVTISQMVELRNLISTLRQNNPLFENLVKNELIDEAHYKRLKELQFDLAVVDICPMSRILAVIPYNLGLPFIGMSTMQEPWLTRNPALPSFAPSNMFTGEYTPRMSFWQRLNNLWMTVEWNASPRVDYLEDDYIRRYIRDNQPVATINELIRQCMLVLMDSDIVLDYARPLMPHEIPIAGLTTKPAKPLSEDLAEFMKSSPNGVIIMTFGSLGFGLDPLIWGEFVKAFKAINYNIIWKYVEEPEGLSSNVKISKWLPQNDLLGHQNTNIFITHCGNNGQMEALYHGVPMIGFPIFGDQMYNCERLSYHGFGICLDPLTFKAVHLVDAVTEIMSNSSYHKNMKKASAIFKDHAETPRKRALYWVEHVMKYGGTHLRAHALDMPWYEYLMLDVAVFVILALLSTTLVCAILVYMAYTFLMVKMSNQAHTKHD